MFRRAVLVLLLLVLGVVIGCGGSTEQPTTVHIKAGRMNNMKPKDK
ncbi:MAG: hypothetical protein ACJ8F7_15460 [Gemmataceae bacterium]